MIFDNFYLSFYKAPKQLHKSYNKNGLTILKQVK